MAKVIYNRKETEEQFKPLIPNTIIERMFMSICTDEQMKTYITKAESPEPAIRAGATAYASAKVERIFSYWRDDFIRQGGDLDWLNFKLWKGSR